MEVCCRLSLGRSATARGLIAWGMWVQAVGLFVVGLGNFRTDTTALFRACGGGWWNRMDVAPAKAWDIELIP